MEKGIFVNEIRPGAVVDGVFCVAAKSLRSTRAGQPYLALTLMDRTGEIEARVWDGAAELDGLFTQGDFVKLDAEGQEYNGQVQLKVNRLEPVDPEALDPALFVPSTEMDVEQGFSFLKEVMAGLPSNGLAQLLDTIFSDKELAKAFVQAPAARRMHHAVIGGLLEHSLSLVMLARKVCDLYGHLDRNLLEAAAICHDLGKTREFSWRSIPFDYTKEGRLLGHIAIGLEIIDSAAIKAGLSPEDHPILLHLKHIVLSHHGRLEFGSPVLPMTEEAVVFHMLDDLDAKINFLGGLRADLADELSSQEEAWSPYQRLFERFFLLTGGQMSNPARALDRLVREVRMSGQEEAAEQDAKRRSRRSGKSKDARTATLFGTQNELF